MLTELIGFILIVLVMVVVIVRRQMLKGRLSQVQLDDAADTLQLRLERAADHIIERMEDHIDQLELLLVEADKKIVLLDGRIEELKNLSAPECLHLAQSLDSVSAKEQVRPTKITRAKEVSALDFPKITGKETKEKRKIELKPSKINQSVLEMLQNGHTVDEIAKKTGIGKGAILLIQEMYGSA